MSTETENKLARAARSAQRLAQLTELPREDSNLDLFPDDAARATQHALSIDIRQGTLSGFELPGELLAAASAATAASAGHPAALAAAGEGKAARRASRAAKVDRGAVASAEADSGSVGLVDEAGSADDAMRGVALATGGATSVAGGASSGRAAGEVGHEPAAVSSLEVANPTVAVVDASAAADAADSVDAAGTPDIAHAPAAQSGADVPIAADRPTASTPAHATQVATPSSVNADADTPAVSASAALMQSVAAMRQAQAKEPTRARGGVEGAAPGSSTATRPGAAEAQQRFATSFARSTAASTVASTAGATAAAAPFSTAAAASSNPTAPAYAAAPAAPSVTPELDHARATAFADTVDALYSVIADQRRTAGEHSRRMKWLLSIVVCALLVTVAIGIAQTMLLMRLTHDTNLQQQRIEQMMLNQQATLSTLLDTDSATVSAPAFAPAPAIPRATEPSSQSTDAAVTRHATKPRHPHKAKPGTQQAQASH